MQHARSALRIGLAPILLSVAAGAQGPRFVDRTAASGIDVVTWSGSVDKPHILESTGNGILVVDYDGDGYQDLYFVAAHRLPHALDETERSALYRNQGDGSFREVSERAGVGARGYGHGGCVGDFDADGRPDLYLTAFGPNRLFHNRGDGGFDEVGSAAGVADASWSIGCTFFDADGDGDQDLFVANYIAASWEDVAAARRTRMWRGKVAVMDGPRGLPEAANTFYRNDGGGRFAVATAAAGLATGGGGYSMGVASLDYDGDGDVDLYVANDSTPNRLYENRGAGRFEEVGTWAGAGHDADGRVQGSMGVGVGDYDGDGLLDLAVTNFAHDHYALYRNLGRGAFADVATPAGVAVPTFAPLGWAAIFLDAENDGDLDLFFANGHIYPQVDEEPTLGESYRQVNQLLVNDEGRFRDAGMAAGEALAARQSSRGAAAVDLENDGDVDLVVSNQDALPQVLENRSAPAGNWLLVELARQAGLGLGTRVRVSAVGRSQIRERSSGAGYASENDPRLHFGLGAAPAVRVAVRRGDGRLAAFHGLPVNRVLVIARAGGRR